MKTRSAILGTVYNPFMIRYWLENFKIWQDKVDTLYICLDRFHCKEVEDYLGKEIEKFPKIKILRGLGDYPRNVERAIKETKEDLIILIHDDVYVYDPDILDKYFDMAEEGKVVSPLQSIFTLPEGMKDAFEKKYPFMPWKIDDYSSYSFILYFTFCSRENYLKTEIDLGLDVRDKGFYIKELDYTVEESCGGETGFWQGLQFLDKNIEVFSIKSNQCADIPHSKNPIEEFNRMADEGLDWLHLQNVARTMPLWFLTEEDFYGGEDMTHKIHLIESLRGNMAVMEDMALKIAWLKEFMAVDSFKGIKDFYSYASAELEYVIDYMAVDRAKIEEHVKVIKKLGVEK